MKCLRIGILVILSLSVLTSCKADKSDKMAEGLIQAFGSSCSSYGAWSSTANKQTQNLIHQFEELKKVDACAGFAENLQAINYMTQQIHNIYSEPAYLRYRELEEELQELSIAASSATDPALIDAFKEEMIFRQVELAKARAEKSVEGSVNNRVGYQDAYSTYTSEVSKAFSSVFMQTQSLSSCLQQSPGAMVTLTGSMMGAAGSFASPVLGANLQVLSVIMGGIVRTLQHQKIDKKIWELHEAQMPTAVTCALESMSNFYCQAEDAAEIIRMQVDNRDDGANESTDLWKGIEIVTTFLPVINNWLLQVKAGTAPQNDEDANKKIKVLQKSNTLETKSLLVTSMFNEYLNRIGGIDDINTIKELTTDVVTSVSYELAPMGRYSATDPFHEYRTSYFDYACYLLEGIVRKCSYDLQRDGIKAYVRRMIDERNITLTIIKNKNWPDILAQVTRKVDIEFNEYIFEDPRMLMSKSHESTLKNISPRATLDVIEEFLQTFIDRSRVDHPTRVPIIEERIDEIREVKDIMDNFHKYYDRKCVKNKGINIDNCDEDEQYKNPLRAVYDIFRLNRDDHYFNERLIEFINWDLVDRFKNGEVPDNINDIISDTSGEIYRRLVAAGYDDLYSITSDLDTARIQSKDNIKIFRSFMLSKIKKIIKKLNIEAVKEDPDDELNRPYSQQLARLCVMLYVTGDKWPSEDTKSICMQSKLLSPNRSIDETLKIQVGQLDEELSVIEKPSRRAKARACVYYKFLRANRLAEIVQPDTEGKSIQELIKPLYLGSGSY